jgi:hypothetical protein
MLARRVGRRLVHDGCDQCVTLTWGAIQSATPECDVTTIGRGVRGDVSKPRKATPHTTLTVGAVIETG